jgi:hypothetical protein
VAVASTNLGCWPAGFSVSMITNGPGCWKRGTAAARSGPCGEVRLFASAATAYRAQARRSTSGRLSLTNTGNRWQSVALPTGVSPATRASCWHSAAVLRSKNSPVCAHASRRVLELVRRPGSCSPPRMSHTQRPVSNGEGRAAISVALSPERCGATSSHRQDATWQRYVDGAYRLWMRDPASRC